MRPKVEWRENAFSYSSNLFVPRLGFYIPVPPCSSVKVCVLRRQKWVCWSRSRVAVPLQILNRSGCGPPRSPGSRYDHNRSRAKHRIIKALHGALSCNRAFPSIDQTPPSTLLMRFLFSDLATPGVNARRAGAWGETRLERSFGAAQVTPGGISQIHQSVL